MSVVIVHGMVMKSVEVAVEAASQRSEIAAQLVTSPQDEPNQQTDSAAIHEARRLVAEAPRRRAYTIAVDTIEKLDRAAVRPS